MNPDTVNPYQAPRQASGRLDRRESTFFTWLAAGAAVVVFLGVLVSRAGFRKTFLDFGVALPGITMVCLHPMFPWLLAMVFLTAIFGIEFAFGKQPIKKALSAAVLVLALLVGAVYALAMYLPFAMLVQALQ